MPRHPDARDRILDAAEVLLASLGYRRMTVEKIAREAGIGKGTIYLHFASKARVVLGTIVRLVDGLVERMAEIAAGPQPVEERLCEMLVLRVRVRFDHARHYRESLDDLLADIRPELFRFRHRAFLSEARLLAAVLEELGPGAGVDPAVARDLVTATNSLLPTSLSARELGQRSEVLARAGRIAELLIAGLRTHGAAASPARPPLKPGSRDIAMKRNAHDRSRASARVPRVFAAAALFATLLGSAPLAAQEARPLTALDADSRKTVIEEMAELLVAEHLFPDKGRDCAQHLRGLLGDGTLDDVSDPGELAQILTAELRTVNHDLHLRVEHGLADVFDPQEGEEIDPEEARRRMRQRFRRGNYGFRRVEILDGQIGYLDLRMFAPVEVAGATATAAMALLADSDAVLVDLRRNGGGSGEMVQLLASYFFREPTHLVSYETRGEELVVQSWTLPHVPGRRLPDVPLYVLTSGRTGSAAEEFTYDLKHHGRATIVGETTGGGGHTCVSKRVAGTFNLVIPHGRPIHPVTGGDWEGVGVAPDIEVPADDALLRAHLEAIQALEGRTEAAEELAGLRWVREGIEAELNPLKLSPEVLGEYAGPYGPVQVSVQPGGLLAVMGPNHLELRAFGEDRFLVTDLEERVRFARDDEGAVSALEVLFSDGRVKEFPRME